jgi:hypothetical protein
VWGGKLAYQPSARNNEATKVRRVPQGLRHSTLDTKRVPVMMVRLTMRPAFMVVAELNNGTLLVLSESYSGV